MHHGSGSAHCTLQLPCLSMHKQPTCSGHVHPHPKSVRCCSVAPQAMREACKQLGKSKSEGREARLASLSSRIGLTESFVRARVLNTSGAHGEALALCNELLNTIPTDGQVRVRWRSNARQPSKRTKPTGASNERQRSKHTQLIGGGTQVTVCTHIDRHVCRWVSLQHMCVVESAARCWGARRLIPCWVSCGGEDGLQTSEG